MANDVNQIERTDICKFCGVIGVKTDPINQHCDDCINYQSRKKDEYLIYVDCATQLGWTVKTYGEWLAS